MRNGECGLRNEDRSQETGVRRNANFGMVFRQEIPKSPSNQPPFRRLPVRSVLQGGLSESNTDILPASAGLFAWLQPLTVRRCRSLSVGLLNSLRAVLH